MSNGIKQLLIGDFLEQSPNCVLLDVRTPAEYLKGHIPGSFNLPLFSNDERAQVGTTYKQIGRQEAIELGLGLVGPKMLHLVQEAKRLSDGKPVFVYCWRGGMRSGSVAWLLQTTGMAVVQLVGGYKAYRNHFYKLLDKHPWQLAIIGGRTGSGKTDILAQLKAKGEQVVDLEALACHKGSAFGALGQAPQPSSEHFENLIHQQFCGFSPSKTVWLEGESQGIGTCFIPLQLYGLMQKGFYINILVPKELRIERLVREYAVFPKEMLRDAVLHIKKRLGGLVAAQVLEAIDQSDFRKVADLTLNYYDKTYDYAYSVRQSEKTLQEFDHDNADKMAEGIRKMLSPVGLLDKRLNR